MGNIASNSFLGLPWPLCLFFFMKVKEKQTKQWLTLSCCIFQSQYKEAVEQSTKALELNPAYVKALVRRAEAHEKLDQLDEALTGLQTTLLVQLYSYSYPP